MVKKATIVALLAVFLLSEFVREVVIVINIGIVPKGLIKVRNDVKQSSPKVRY
jgi:hypothetical protein